MTSSLTPAQQLALTHAELQIAAILLALEETTGLVVDNAYQIRKRNGGIQTYIFLMEKKRF